MKLPKFLTATDPETPADGREATSGSRPTRIAYAEFNVSPIELARVLTIAVAFLIVMTFVAQLMKWQHFWLAGARFFDSDDRVNIPSGFKILTLTASALVVWAIARAAAQTGDHWTRDWHALAVLVGFLAIDETTRLHKSISGSHFSWILIYLPAAAIAIYFLWDFFRKMAKPARAQFALGGLLFIAGAGMVELFKALFKEDVTAPAFLFTAAFSDSVEFVGMSIFLVAAVAEFGRRAVAARLIVGRDNFPIEEATASPDEVNEVAAIPGRVLASREDRYDAPDWWEPKT